ncbi:cytochrome c biogenesis protein CcsA [Rhodospirillaceae bacterium KN72]|uniref:Cytochrome c biogenesis protein CcsA n=1 Tax=Pacificispira spongiicola TaxID=2729598 RepID=A0A7Y0E2E6_9PROT|nr:cytochrome c biogenesis protein CcsA [Pacificispira spongiicola]NMM45992.1 cytochrome c biogenesis protein CcsA [Pacificispira spongiicola]
MTLAVFGPVVWCIMALQAGWRTDFAFTLWVSVAGTLLLYGMVALAAPIARSLAVLVLPYLASLILLAILLDSGDRMLSGAPDPWILVHIVLAVTTYALITLSALAALSVFVKERALKSRRNDAVSRRLPPVAEAERLQDHLMMVGEVVLGFGVATGIAIHVHRGDPLLALDHKTLLTIAAFLVIGGLIVLQRLVGLRGRLAAQLVMIAYLLVTLGYPGVKFVTDILEG